MSTELQMSFTVQQTPAQVFDAINDVRSWWGTGIVGDTATVGAEWVYTVPDLHFSKLRTTELRRGERVEWLVLDSHLSFIEDEQEWTGTTVRFDISPDDAAEGRTRLTFAHLGLNSAHECFEVCNTAWGQYILGSLRDRIASSAGRPDSFSNQASLEAALAGTVQMPEAD